MATFSIIRLFLALIFTTSSALKIENLCGQWVVEEATGKYTDLKATVPGGIYSDLMDNHKIGNVFYGYNDTETRWVAQTNWTYSRQFTVDNAILEHDKINIVFEGLDTFATVVINKVVVGESENMFLRYIFNVKSVLKPGNNTIEVRFTSPILMANEKTSLQGYTVPPNCPPSAYRGECHVNQIRKMQASFSWDWGPAFPSMGIWKEVYLEAFNTSRIRYFFADYQEAPDSSWLIIVSSFLSAEKGETVNGKLLYWLHTDVAVVEQIVDVNHTNNGTDPDLRVDFSFTVPKLTVRNWWPNRYGEQKLYNLTVKFHSGSEEDLKTIKIGFRKIELIQEKIGNGLSFYFKVNDVPIFAKGANEIPLDILPEKGQNPETVFRILKSAHDANMNMLRVWGGGVYESDYFYETADELGILIWQDFMFACALYPTYPNFLSTVRAEVRHQVQRLYSHPSIAVWAGNNENEVALMGNWYGPNNQTYKHDYIKLYIDTIKAELDKISTNVIFLASSPSNGDVSVQDGYLSLDPQNPLYGDVHFYNYIMNSLNINTYPIPRFASEYGYQSLPDVDTWLTVTENVTDLDPNSAFMDHRQHHPFGLLENTLLINYQLQLNSSSSNYYKIYIFYSQIVQALSIKLETEYYRSFMGRVNNSTSEGNTMGALFWQLNDVWVAPTWSSIDYTGKWKMLHYFAKNFYAPTLVTGFLNTERQLIIYVVSEVPSLVDTQLDVSVMVEVYRWESFSIIDSKQFDVSLEFGKSAQVVEINTDSFLANLNCGSLSSARTNCFFYLTLYYQNTVIAPNNFVLATSLKNSNIANAAVKLYSFLQIDENSTKFEITITSNGISLFVWLDSHQICGKFSENGFLQVTPTKVIIFQSEKPTTAAILEKVITVTHLKDPQYSL